MPLRACAAAAIVLLGAVSAADLPQRRIAFSDLLPPVRRALGTRAASPAAFADFVAGLERRTAQRLVEGEFEHLVNFILQSQQFTTLPPVEPALSAKAFVDAMSPTDRDRLLTIPGYVPPAKYVPADAATRIHAFIDRVGKPATSERVAYFAQMLKDRVRAVGPPFDYVYEHYARVARFLYLKDFVHRTDAPAAASLYQQRGHSSDTQVEAGYGVSTGLAALKAGQPKLAIERALVVGPGLDFAPRTDLIDLFPPQSYQPFAVADALLKLKLAANARRLQVHCVDINSRVLEHLQELSTRPRVRLSLMSGIPDTPTQPLTADFREYFHGFGAGIGTAGPLSQVGELPAAYRSYLTKTVIVRPEVVAAITAARLDVVTTRYHGALFDLVVVTNVFPYFDDLELWLALSNIAAMLKPGGFLIHNEPRGALLDASDASGLPAIQSRSVLIAQGPGGARAGALYDTVWVHRKNNVASGVGRTRRN